MFLLTTRWVSALPLTLLLCFSLTSEAPQRAGPMRPIWPAFLGRAATSPSLPKSPHFWPCPRPKSPGACPSTKPECSRQGWAEATVNRRLCRRALAASVLLPAGIVGDRRAGPGGTARKLQTYRDTRGVDVKTLKKLVALPAQVHGQTLLGLRDTALLRLLSENALRRAEVCSVSVGDFSAAESRLRIVGKGKGTQKLPVTLSPKLAGAIAAYLLAGGTRSGPGRGPLFRSLDRRPGRNGGRLTAGGLYLIVQGYGRRLGVSLAPHKLRHSAITAGT